MEAAHGVEAVAEVAGQVWEPWGADPGPGPVGPLAADQDDPQLLVEEAAAAEGQTGQLARITWAPPPAQWTAACGDTSPSYGPTPPGPTAASSY